MPNEQFPGAKQLILRSLEAAKQGRYCYVCIQYETDEADISITYRSDKGKEEIEIEEE